MRKTPRWYDEEIERHAKLILNDGETEDQAKVSLRMVVRDEHREFGNAVLDEYNTPNLKAAVAALRSRRAAELRAELAEARARAQTEAPQPPAPRPEPRQSAPAPELTPAPPAPRPALKPDNGRITALEEELSKITPPADPEWDLHRTLFPDFAFRSLKVTPERYEQVHKMTGHQLDMARNILLAKTQNAIDGAQAERDRFERFYGKVRPLMHGDDTVADAERKISTEVRV